VVAFVSDLFRTLDAKEQRAKVKARRAKSGVRAAIAAAKTMA
jgi:hypothetical protein